MTAPPPGATRLGILSDTHGRADTCRDAIRLLADLGAQAFAHCGDVGEEPVLEELAGHPVWFIWGNNDFDRQRLAWYAGKLGLVCLGDFGRFEFAGRQFVIKHGDNGRYLSQVREAALRSEAAHGAPAPDDYLLTGHTHVAHDRRIGKLRWINPGALYRARPKTVALLDVSTDELRLHELA